MLLRVPAEVRKRLLVRIEQLAECLAQARHVDAPPREAERQHEDVSHLPLRVEPDAGLSPVSPVSPVDLALQSRRRPRTASASPTCAIAPPATAARTASPSRSCRGTPAAGAPGTGPRRVVHRRRPAPQVLGVRGQQRLRPCRPLVRPPLRLPQHRRTVLRSRSSWRPIAPNRRARTRPTMDLLPPVPSDHLNLPSIRCSTEIVVPVVDICSSPQ